MLFLIACGDPVTNSIFLEDLEYINALPQPEYHRIQLEEGEVIHTVEEYSPFEIPAAAPELWATTLESINNINDFNIEMLGYVAWVRNTPPTIREEDRRVWGPFTTDDTGTTEMRVTIERTGTASYLWTFDVAPADTEEWQSVFVGSHLAGSTVINGVGRYLVDFGHLYDLIDDEKEDSTYLEIDYDFTFDREIAVNMWYVESDRTKPPDATYNYSLTDQLGQFTLESRFQFLEEGPLEDYTIQSRWVPGGAGRGDAEISGTDVLAKTGTETIWYSQCWDSSGDLTYQAAELLLVPTKGSASYCPFDSAFE